MLKEQAAAKAENNLYVDSILLILHFQISQGDCLSGCLAAFLGWIRRQGKEDSPATDKPSPLLLACYGSALIVRRAAKAAYEAKGRAMGASDLIDQLGPVVDDMVGDRPGRSAL